MRVDHRVDHIGAHYVFTKRGVYYFSRRIPKGLQHRFAKTRVVMCLHTRNEQDAIQAAHRVSVQLEVVWGQMKLEAMGIKLSSPATQPLDQRAPIHALGEAERSYSEDVRLSDAKAVYLRLKGVGKQQLFFDAANRNFGYAIECLGDRPIAELGRADAAKFRDHLIKRNLGASSIKRVMNTVRAGVNLALSEYGLNTPNPFSGTFIPSVGTKRDRPSIPAEALGAVQQLCRAEDDPRRWLIALISDTGMRLAEAAGLARTDIYLEDEIPHVRIQGKRQGDPVA